MGSNSSHVLAACHQAISRLLVTSALGALTHSIYAQTATTAPQAAFEVASVRACPQNHGYMTQNQYPTSRVALHNMPLNIAIAMAFGHDSTHISGPNWITDVCYDIDAKTNDEKQLSLEEMKPLLQNLLEQRFHLQVHRETRLVSGYDLVVAKGGPKLSKADEKEKDYLYILTDGIRVRRRTVENLAFALASTAGGPVVNRTGIQGEYDFNLHYATVRNPDANLPDFFTAVEEQLGLKLVPAKVSVQYLVIDHVDRLPTDN